MATRRTAKRKAAKKAPAKRKASKRQPRKKTQAQARELKRLRAKVARAEKARAALEQVRLRNRALAQENRELAGPGWRGLNKADLKEMILRGTPRQRAIAKREIFRREPNLREDPYEFARLLHQELGLDYGEAIQLFYYG